MYRKKVDYIMRKQSGFTLVELMIVVAIVGVLSAIALPAFKTYQVRTIRGDECKKPLYEIALELEKFHQLNGTYATLFGSTDPTTQINYKEYSDPADTTGSNYKYVITKGTTANIQNSFVITCAKQTGNDDEDCGDLTLDNFGREGMVNAVSGSTRTAEICWR